MFHPKETDNKETAANSAGLIKNKFALVTYCFMHVSHQFNPGNHGSRGLFSKWLQDEVSLCTQKYPLEPRECQPKIKLRIFVQRIRRVKVYLNISCPLFSMVYIVMYTGLQLIGYISPKYTLLEFDNSGVYLVADQRRIMASTSRFLRLLLESK